MGSTTGNKIITSGQRSLKSKSFIKQTPPKVGILIQNTISKFFKTKNQTQKRPPKVPKKLKTYIRRPQIKKFYKTDPPKIGNSDSKYNFEIFTNKKSNSKKTPYISKISKKYIRRPQIKTFYKTDPPKVGFLIQNKISKFSKTKN